jgi:hypothetical protein
MWHYFLKLFVLHFGVFWTLYGVATIISFGVPIIGLFLGNAYFSWISLFNTGSLSELGDAYIFSSSVQGLFGMLVHKVFLKSRPNLVFKKHILIAIIIQLLLFIVLSLSAFFVVIYDLVDVSMPS